MCARNINLVEKKLAKKISVGSIWVVSLKLGFIFTVFAYL